jgi:hypothetical protein
MTDLAPAEIEAARLISDLRAGHEEALAQAYKMTFGHLLGRLVLADFMRACGVGDTLGPHVDGPARHYQAGRHDAAIVLLRSAGYDQPSTVVAAFGGDLEERENEDPVAAYRPLDDEDF